LGVEGGDRDVDDSHFSYGAMAAAGLDEDGDEGLYRNSLADILMEYTMF